MRRLTTILLAAVTAALGSLVGAGAASAAPMRNVTCSGSWQSGPGMLMSGTYSHVTVAGVCLVPDGQSITIRGGMTLQPGAQLLAFFTSQQMAIYGGISVGQGAVLGLGCSAELGCDGSNDNPPSQDVVHGDIVADGAMAMYLNGDTVYGNVSFLGGGAGRDCTDPNPESSIGHDLVVKDNDFHGTVTLQGWAGCWMGFIRNTVHGVVTIADNYANPLWLAQGPDSTEVATNTIWGALNCSGNTPAAQLGDSGGSLNTVHGSATGECVSLVS